MRRLTSDPLGKGKYRAIWDGRDNQGRAVASGIYVIRLTGSVEPASAKILYLRE